MRRLQRRDRTILSAVVASVVGVTGVTLVLGSSCLGGVPASDTPTSHRTSAGGVPAEEATSTTELTSAESEIVSTPQIVIPEVVDEAANAAAPQSQPQPQRLYTAPPAAPVAQPTAPPAATQVTPQPTAEPRVQNTSGLVAPLAVDPLGSNNLPPPVNTALPPQQPVVDGGASLASQAPNPSAAPIADGGAGAPATGTAARLPVGPILFGIPPVPMPPPQSGGQAPTQPSGQPTPPAEQRPAQPPTIQAPPAAPFGGQPPGAR